MGQHHLATLTGVGSYTEINPAWESEIREGIFAQHVRQQGGTLVTHRISAQWAADLFLTYVTSAMRYTIGTWWENNHEIVYTVNMSDNPQTVACRITNDAHPFPFRMQGEYTSYRGALYLRDVNGTGPTSGTLLIADDPSYGFADTPPLVAY